MLNVLSLIKHYPQMLFFLPTFLLTFILSSLAFFIFLIIWRVQHFHCHFCLFPLYHPSIHLTTNHLLHFIHRMDQKECYLYFSDTIEDLWMNANLYIHLLIIKCLPSSGIYSSSSSYYSS